MLAKLDNVLISLPRADTSSLIHLVDIKSSSDPV